MKVPFNNILYAEALIDFSKLYLQEETMSVSAHLKMMEDMLPPFPPLGVHRSFMVALDKITAMQGNVVEIAKVQIPVGTTYKEELVKRLGI